METVFSNYIWLFITPLPPHRRAAFLNSRVRGAHSLEEAGLTGCAHQQQEAHTTSLPTLLPEPGGGLLQQRPGSGQVTCCLPALTGGSQCSQVSPTPFFSGSFPNKSLCRASLSCQQTIYRKARRVHKILFVKTILIFRSWGICKQ